MRFLLPAELSAFNLFQMSKEKNQQQQQESKTGRGDLLVNVCSLPLGQRRLLHVCVASALLSVTVCNTVNHLNAI